MIEAKFGDQIAITPYNIFFDDTAEITDLMDKVHWDGVKLPAVFINGEPVTSGYMDELTTSRALLSYGLK